MGPLGELDLHDEPRLPEDGTARRLAAVEGTRAPTQRLEQTGQAVEMLLAQPTTDPPGVAQRPVLVVVEAGEERADASTATALPGHPPAHHELCRPPVLDLDPRPGATPRLVRAVQALGHHPLEPLIAAGAHHVLPIADVGRGRAPVRPLELQPVEPAAALAVGQRQR